MPSTTKSIQHLIGVKFNRLTILEDVGKIKAQRHCKALCDCGNIITVRVSSLKNNSTKSCGCLIKDFNSSKIKNIDHLVGHTFNRLTITEILKQVGKKKYCMAICECGNVRKHEVASLKSGGTKSCGCLRTESNLTGNNRRVHGLTSHPLNRIWSDMKKRCYTKSYKFYNQYGGRWVIVCKEWLDSFTNFYNWAISNGWKKGLYLDKDKLSPNRSGTIYSPEYCCFLTRNENMQYRSDSIVIEFEGIKKCLAEWCRFLNLNYHSINERIRRGWEPKIALETPILSTFIRNKK